MPDVGKFQQVFVQASQAEGFLEELLMRAGAATRGHHAVEPMGFDGLAHGLLRKGSRCRNVFCYVDHVGQALGSLPESSQIHSAAIVRTVLTKENTHPRPFKNDGVLRRIISPGGCRLPGGGQHAGCGRRCRRRFDDRIGNVFGPGEGTACKNAGAGGGDRSEISDQRKAALVELDVQFVGQLLHLGGRFKTHREHHQVKVFILLSAALIHVPQPEIVRPGPGGLDGVDSRPNEAHPCLVPGVVVEFLIAFTKRAHVHEENSRIQGAVELFGGQRFLDGIHTADSGAIPMRTFMQVAGADTLQPGDLPGRLVVGWTQRSPAARPVRIDDGFKFKTRNHIGKNPVSEGIKMARIKNLESRGKDDRTNVEHQVFVSAVGGG